MVGWLVMVLWWCVYIYQFIHPLHPSVNGHTNNHHAPSFETKKGTATHLNDAVEGGALVPDGQPRLPVFPWRVKGGGG